MRDEPETMQVGIPKPRMSRATIYIATSEKMLLAKLEWPWNIDEEEQKRSLRDVAYHA
jgi:hypothetical protein